LIRKQEGKIEIIVSVYWILILTILLAVFMQLLQFQATKSYVEDALAASNLASAVIDIETYGILHELIIADPDAAYDLYKEALKINLDLNDYWENTNKAIITGQVEILEYVIYNVRGEDVEIHFFNAGVRSSWTVYGGLGSVTAQEGTLIETTSIYSRIGFPVEGIMGVLIDARKENLVDIKSE